MKEQKTTYFHILGIPYTATDDQVRRSYLMLARQWHPDKHVALSGAQKIRAQNQFQMINRAYIHLKTKPQRDAYIRTLQKIYLSNRNTLTHQHPMDAPKRKSGKLYIFWQLLIEILWPFVPANGLGQDTNLQTNGLKTRLNTGEASYG